MVHFKIGVARGVPSSFPLLLIVKLTSGDAVCSRIIAGVRKKQCVVCCGVLQCVAVCCSVL